MDFVVNYAKEILEFGLEKWVPADRVVLVIETI